MSDDKRHFQVTLAPQGTNVLKRSTREKVVPQNLDRTNSLNFDTLNDLTTQESSKKQSWFTAAGNAIDEV